MWHIADAHTWTTITSVHSEAEGFLVRSQSSLLLLRSTGVWQGKASPGSGISLGVRACPPRTPTPLPYLHPAGSSATAPVHARWQRDQEEKAGEKSPQKRQAEPHSLAVLPGQGGGPVTGTPDAIAPWGLLKSLHYQGICRGPLTSPAPPATSWGCLFRVCAPREPDA